MRDGDIVVGDLAIGVQEAKAIFFRTADPAVPEDPHYDGKKCPDSGATTCALYPAVPLSWSMTGDLPKYYFVGYGGVNDDTWQDALGVALGETPAPDRSVEDAFIAADSDVRDLFDQAQPL